MIVYLAGSRMATTAVPERFVPARMRGELVEAEHLARYHFAARYAMGRRVLDAGCGTGYGAALMAAGGAARVTGVDRAAAIVEDARAECPPGVELLEGDVRDLPFDDGTFDLVVCFEVIEHIEHPEEALRELARVVSPNGLVMVSSPNRDVYVPGNPHHVHEYTPGELRAALEEHLPHVTLRRQANLVASCLMPDEIAASDDAEPVADLELRKCVALEPGAETYTVAIASHAPLRLDRGSVAVATGVTEVRRWLELYDGQQAILDDLLARLETGESTATVRELRAALLEAERTSAQLPILHEHLDRLETEKRGLLEQLERADRVLAGMKASPSWRLTAPLRRVKRRLRRPRPV